MGINGLLTDVRWEWTGTELTSDLLTGVTVLPVLDPTSISEEELVWIAGTGPYDVVEVDEEGSTFTIAPGLEIDVDNGTEVANDIGGQPGRAWVCEVLLNDAESPVEVPLTIHDLAVMPEGTYDPPVTIVLSDDLQVVENLPGSLPIIDGVYIPSDSLPVPPLSDGLPPVVSPAATVIGGIGALFVQWPTISNPDPVTYEVHLSLLDGFDPDASTLATEIRGTSTTLRTLPDGSPLTYYDVDGITPTVYYARIVAKDEDPGAAPPGVQGSGSMMQITGPDVSAAYVYAGNIIADQILAGNLNADVALFGSINIPPNIFINPEDGIVIKQLDGRQTQLSADGSGDTFVGKGTFDSAEFMDQVTMRGVQNNLNGILTASSGVTDPSSKLSVTTSYSGGNIGGSGYARRGMTSRSDNLGIYCTDTVSGIASNVQSWLYDGEPGWSGFDILSTWMGYGGVTRLGNRFYVLCNRTTDPNNWRILLYDRNPSDGTFTYVTSWPTHPTTGITPTAYPIIGNDGTDLLLAWPDNGTVYIRRISVTTGAQTGSTLSVPGTGSWGGATPTASVAQLGAIYYIGYSGGMRAYTVSGTDLVRSTANEFPLASPTAMVGAFHDGTRWRSFHGGRYLYQYTNNSGTWDFGYTWADDDTTGGSTTAETRVSPLFRIAPTKFAKWTLTLPSKPPDDGTVDGANTAKIYGALAGAALYRLTSLAEGVISATYDPVPTSGAAYVPSSGFESRPSSAFGILQSSKTDGSGPIWKLSGNGVWRLGEFSADTNGRITTDFVSLTVSASGYTGTVELTRVGPFILCETAITRTSGFTNTFVPMGVTVPANWRPAATITTPSFSMYGGTSSYSFAYYTDGRVGVRMSAAVTGTMLNQIVWRANP